MLGCLIKKQLLEIYSSVFINRKTGKRRGVGGIIGYGFLMLFIAAALCVMFGSYAFLLSELLYMGEDKEWIFYAMAAMMAMLLGIFGSVFNTYSSIYNAKDNELLLAMPIPPSKILIARMFGVYCTSLLYTSLAWLPQIVVSWLMTETTAAKIIFPVISVFLLAMFVTVVSCALGWLVALVSSRLKNKSFVTLAITLVCFAAYYYVCFNVNTLLAQLVANSVKVGAAIKAKLFYVYEIARAAQGDGLALLAVCGMTLVMFALCCYIMSRSFIAITTRNTGDKKVAYNRQTLKAADSGKALLRREFKHLTSSSSYMLNSGLGLVIAPVVAIVAIIKKSALLDTVYVLLMLEPSIEAVIPAAIVGAVIMLVAMNNFTAPSVSLEGNTLWILRSLPVDTKDIFKAKEKFHIILNTPPVLFLTAVLCFILGTDISSGGLVCASVWAFIVFTADMGLMLDVLNPNLNWTSEAVPIKRSMPVTVMLFGGWILGVAVVAAAYFLRKLLSTQMILTVILAVIVIAYRIVHGWLMTKGVKRFENI